MIFLWSFGASPDACNTDGMTSLRWFAIALLVASCRHADHYRHPCDGFTEISLEVIDHRPTDATMQEEGPSCALAPTGKNADPDKAASKLKFAHEMIDRGDCHDAEDEAEASFAYAGDRAALELALVAARCAHDHLSEHRQLRCFLNTPGADVVRLSRELRATEQATGLLRVQCPNGHSITFSIDDEHKQTYRCDTQIRLEPGAHHVNLDGQPSFSVTVPAGQRITVGMGEIEHDC